MYQPITAPTLYRAVCRNGKMREFWRYDKACEWLDKHEPSHANGTFHNIIWQNAIIYGALRHINHVTHRLAGE